MGEGNIGKGVDKWDAAVLKCDKTKRQRTSA